MQGLPRELYSICRNILLKCDEFDSDSSLRAIFVTEELQPFRNSLPEAANRDERIGKCLDFLTPQRFSDDRPIFPLFLAILREKIPGG